MATAVINKLYSYVSPPNVKELLVLQCTFSLVPSHCGDGIGFARCFSCLIPKLSILTLF